MKRNFRITIQPFVIEADSQETAERLASAMVPNQNVIVEEVMSVDSILVDLLGEEDAKLFMTDIEERRDKS